MNSGESERICFCANEATGSHTTSLPVANARFSFRALVKVQSLLLVFQLFRNVSAITKYFRHAACSYKIRLQSMEEEGHVLWTLMRNSMGVQARSKDSKGNNPILEPA